MVVRFMFSGPTVGQLRKTVRERPKCLIPLILYYSFLIATLVVLVLEGTSISPHIPNAIAIALAFAFAVVLVDPWVAWMKSQISAGEANTNDKT